MDRESITDMYAMPKRNAEIFIGQMFILFDRDGDGKINFKVGEIICYIRENSISHYEATSMSPVPRDLITLSGQ